MNPNNPVDIDVAGPNPRAWFNSNRYLVPIIAIIVVLLIATMLIGRPYHYNNGRVVRRVVVPAGVVADTRPGIPHEHDGYYVNERGTVLATENVPGVGVVTVDHPASTHQQQR